MYFRFILVFVFLFVSCASARREVRMEVHGASYCVSSQIHFQSPLPSDSEVEKIMNDPELNARFSPKSIRLAIAYGISGDLKEYVKLEQKNKLSKSARPSPEFTTLESKIYRRIQLMSMDVVATASEFRCYVDRFTEIVNQMKSTEDDIVEANTLYAILSGAIFTLIQGGTVYNDPATVVATITGGVLVTYFSYRAYRPNITIEFKPKSTNLKELWYKAEVSKNYSTAMWFIMTKDIIKGEPPMRDLVVKRWIENGFLGSEDKEDRDRHINLFFGEGGVSTLQNISNRKEMNNELKGLIQLIEQDVNGFQIELVSGAKG